MELLETLSITDGAADYLFESAQPIVAPDFVGYVTSYDKRCKIGIAITLDGMPIIFSNTKKPLTPRKIEKVIKKLVKVDFLKMSVEPFEEFNNPFKKDFPLLRAKVFESPIFIRAGEQE